MNISNPLNFGDRVILIAGDAGQSGKQIAQAFLAAGADVVHCCSPQRDKYPGKAPGRQPQLTTLPTLDAEAVTAVVNSVVDRYGRIDVLVTINDGHQRQSSGSPHSAIQAGLITPLHFSQAANSQMQEQTGGGSILNISLDQGQGLTAQPCVAGAASAGLANLGTSLAVEWAPRVRVNSISLVLPPTEPPPTAINQLPYIGNTCLFLASDLASYISGTHLSATTL